jgi:hypothetical protein
MLKRERLIRSVITAGIWLVLWYSSASAHGGIAGPDELGPPVITASALGIAGYWTVMLWPSRRKSRTPDKRQSRFPNQRNRKSKASYQIDERRKAAGQDA